ncbi:MAG: DUF5301 domain-containing protein, partial [Eubacterium sp.]|nr:DUF5301 domain-containing protein [Eubacterium sp.]
MKKKLYSSICLWSFAAITLCACGKQGKPIVLPDREEIISIGVFDGENVGYSPNVEGEADEFIDEFLGILMDMEVTDKEPVNETTVNADYIEISLNCDDKNIILFYYKDKGTE